MNLKGFELKFPIGGMKKMKRLTFDGNFCDIAMCTEAPFGNFCEDGTCSQRQIWERLKMIEDVFGDEFDLDLLRELIKMTREVGCAGA